MDDPGDAATDRSLAVAEEIRELLASRDVACAVIGAAAMAAHGYARATADLDLATATDPFATLRALERELRERGYDAELVTPDADDPLGGVVNVRGEGFDVVQVVNFLNPLRPKANPGADAVASASLAIEGTGLRVVDLPHLVALKLYAGDLKSRVDVVELLRRNPDADLEPIRAVCARHDLATELTEALLELELPERR